MSKCQCASERRPETTKTAFRWGGCSDNVKHGKRVTRNFLDLQPNDGEVDEVSEMLRHDSEVIFFKFSLQYCITTILQVVI